MYGFDSFERTALLLGEAAMERLKRAHVAVFGIGGVGGYVVEALVRSGVGTLTLVDHDTVAASNLNRQIIATTASIGQKKVDVMKERILSINPEVTVYTRDCFFLPEGEELFDFSVYDYVVDAIDTVTAKIELVLRTKEAGTPLISCMGTGNKLDPTGLRIGDLYETSVCPLARVMRRELKKRGIRKLKVLYSTEEPRKVFLTSRQEEEGEEPAKGRRRAVPGSTAFVPPAAGLLIAAQVVKDLTADQESSASGLWKQENSASGSQELESSTSGRRKGERE